ncbi:TetR family transcriptional regulator [Kribbella sp. NBC_00709]|uniref:TetR/AcrR family transcriptional regulator n=1 Tax=Kribbella sp. NBC_00709 TaxID=2975972 RepID=UPI002E28D6A7|nr:TetR family transcriptional regulator [Kribbella sp. NBC_00709]
MNETTRDRRRIETQERILTEARRLFAETGYDRTTIRAVAAAAQVDPGLVMHYFGNKQQLFARAAETESRPLIDGTPEEVAEQLLERLRQSLVEEPVASLAVLRSMLTHPDAADEVRGNPHVQGSNISKAIHGADGELRADVVSAVLIGVVLGRHLLKLNHLAEADPGKIVELLRPAVHSLTTE